MFDWLFGKKKQEPPKKKPEAENKWKYDSLLQFLCSPEWRVTVLNFVDQNCIVFDNEEQNKFSYTEIHNKFKQLVAGLFDSFMQEIGLEADELVELIQKGLQSKNKKVFEQLLICDDFLKFKEIMVKRNKKLAEDAEIELQKQGTKSQLFQSRIPEAPKQIPKPPSLGGHKTPQQLEQQMLQRALEESQRQEEMRQSKIKEREIEQVKQIEKSMVEAKIKQQAQKKESKMKEFALAQQRKIEQEMEEERRKAELERHQQDMERLKLQEQKEKEKEHAPRVLPSVKKPTKPPIMESLNEPPQQEPTPQPQPQVKEQEKKQESIEQRKKRLLEQRQIMRKKKMEERQKQLQNKEKQPEKKVETIVLGDKGINDKHQEKEPEQHDEKISSEEIQRRRNLMKRIKNKIIEDI